MKGTIKIINCLCFISFLTKGDLLSIAGVVGVVGVVAFVAIFFPPELIIEAGDRRSPASVLI